MILLAVKEFGLPPAKALPPELATDWPVRPARANASSVGWPNLASSLMAADTLKSVVGMLIGIIPAVSGQRGLE